MNAPEFHANDVYDNWVSIEGYQLRKKERFELMRMQAFITGRFGNSHPKKFPQTPEAFLPSPYDPPKKAEVKKTGYEEWQERQKMFEELKKKQKVASKDKAAALFGGVITENTK